MENHPINVSICRTPTTKEQILFELLEAYQLAHTDIGILLTNGISHAVYQYGVSVPGEGIVPSIWSFTPTK